jgi:PHD/YefM family antitoxin component YafN of YafNO toxin-antitoxin module
VKYSEPVITDIKPSSSIRHDYNTFSRLCHETQAPVIVTKNGEADLVVMSYEAFQKMVARQRLGQMLAEVDREIAEVRELRDFEATFATLKKRIENA